MESLRREPAAAEARWPMAGAIVAAIVLTVLMPDYIRLGPEWVLPVDRGAVARRGGRRRPGLDHAPLPRVADALDRARVGARDRGAVVDPVADRRPDPRRPGDDLGRRAARGRLDRVGVEQHRVRTALLGARRRRSGGALATRTGAPGPRLPTAPQSGRRPAGAGDRGSSTTSTSASPTRPRSARPT